MEWKKEKLQSFWKISKEKLIFLFCSGLLLFVISIPNGDGKEEASAPAAGVQAGSGNQMVGGTGTGSGSQWTRSKSAGSESQSSGGSAEAGSGLTGVKVGGTDAGVSEIPSGAKTASFGNGKAAATYEEELEERIREILAGVDGVGEVDVMVVLKSSEEKVLHVDRNTSLSTTEEKTGDGTGRTVRQQETVENTVTGSQTQTPVVEKELSPEVSGIVVSADGGGSAAVKAEISEAMEALFGLPAHKVKVLKRVAKQ